MGVVDLKPDEQWPNLTKVDKTIFEDINEFLNQIERCKLEEEENKKKSRTLAERIKQAENKIVEAERTKAYLLKKSENLKESLKSIHGREQKALEYWSDYGLDVRQVSKESDPYHQFEFIFTNISKIEADLKFKIHLKYSDKKLDIVSQEPETIKQEQLEELITRLNNSCVNTTNVDFKSAIVMIKKELIRSVNP